MTDVSSHTNTRHTDTRDVGDRVKDAASATADMAHTQAEAAADAVSARAEKEVSSVAQAAREASDNFEDGSPQAQMTDQLATSLQQMADVLQKTDFNAATAKATGFARENPALFLGGAALLGFAAVRFLKASTPANGGTTHSDSDPWTGHVGASPSQTRVAQNGEAQ